ncbi:tetratricopeptide repeat protein [Fulvivirga maritima]|uniref:tetratricopeptide repeat-containing sensor histidine kinase n=1 Tax=Fulvivirga maritima TaxID=2904247 RepID=UPI001F1F1928|nr:sensor histidine kinase [Fulvivirga maritima]UII25875.1 tetratricopeptide repeat protein [Fulvivirga maritima]
MCSSYKWLGSAAKALNEREKAMGYYKKALDIAIEHQLDNESYRIENNIGILYLESDHFDKAIESFKKSADNTMAPRDKAISMANIALGYQKMEEFDEALKYYHKSMEYCGKLSGDKHECEMQALQGFAGIALERNLFDEALSYNKSIRDYQEERNLVHELFITYNRIGLIYDGKRNIKGAVEYFNKAIAIADSLQSELIPYLYANLSVAYENANQYKLALKYDKVFHHKKDSISALKDQIKLEKLLADYEFDKKEHEISLLKKEGELQATLLESRQNEIRRQHIIRNIVIISSAIIAIIAFIAFRIYRQKVKNKEALALKNEELNKQETLELLRKYELKTVKAFVDGQEREKKRVAQELHDNIAGSLAAIKMRVQKLLTNNDQLATLLPQIDSVYSEVRTISHHLTPDKATIGSHTDFISHYLKNIEDVAPFELNFYFEGEQHISLLTDSMKIELYRVIQEAIQNASKHAHADNLEIQLMVGEELVNLIIEDDGVGFNPGEKSMGIGLRNMKNRVENLEGTLHIDTYPKRGTIINIDIPLSKHKNN